MEWSQGFTSRDSPRGKSSLLDLPRSKENRGGFAVDSYTTLKSIDMVNIPLFTGFHVEWCRMSSINSSSQQNYLRIEANYQTWKWPTRDPSRPIPCKPCSGELNFLKVYRQDPQIPQSLPAKKTQFVSFWSCIPSPNFSFAPATSWIDKLRPTCGVQHVFKQKTCLLNELLATTHFGNNQRGWVKPHSFNQLHSFTVSAGFVQSSPRSMTGQDIFRFSYLHLRIIGF